ncbi:RNA pol II promoter Fmp27 protein domain-containing protein [Aspergillus alliaceus]|uniref:RNA pol II promoter Fmp27 protein domain-containing protein n=1 Tax=Petromyces alliaceus TaxID=209559 RepID=A0A5N7CIG0_PETAA|nr:RNA pol II promoter Fmp27 protein domain-containing protein [Aspergillus alliaceus]
MALTSHIAPVAVGVCFIYFASFLVLAVFRVATGISIQRIGWLSLHHILYSPREGPQIKIHHLGFTFHRPSCHKPTWISIRLEQLIITLDPSLKRTDGAITSEIAPKPLQRTNSVQIDGRNEKNSRHTRPKPIRTILKQTKSFFKYLHQRLGVLALIDITINDSSVSLSNAGRIRIGSISFQLDGLHSKAILAEQTTANWRRKPIEMLNKVDVDLHTLLVRAFGALPRDLSIAVRAGKLHIPYDDLRALCLYIRASPLWPPKESKKSSIGSNRLGEESDTQQLAKSLLQVLQEIRVSTESFQLSWGVQSLGRQNPTAVSIMTHETAFRIKRIEQSAPEHRTSFRVHDIVHQLELTVSSLSVCLESVSKTTESIVYIPTVSLSIKSTILLQTVRACFKEHMDDDNPSILLASLAISSPSIDLQGNSVSQLSGLLNTHNSRASQGKGPDVDYALSGFLPKANIKLSIHEPVVRLLLPITEDIETLNECNTESSLLWTNGTGYSVSSEFRMLSYIFGTESLRLNVNLTADPDVRSIVVGNLNTPTLHMTNQVVWQTICGLLEAYKVHWVAQAGVQGSADRKGMSLLNCILRCLLYFSFNTRALTLNIAGLDSTVSETPRGISVRFEEWMLEYSGGLSNQSVDSIKHNELLGQSCTEKVSASENLHTLGPDNVHPHLTGLNGFTIESEEYGAPESPKDLIVPALDVECQVDRIYLEYSLHRLYCAVVAGSMVQKLFSFSLPYRPTKPDGDTRDPAGFGVPPSQPNAALHSRVRTAKFGIALVQLKSFLPDDVRIMLQLHKFDCGARKECIPSIAAQLVRLHIEAPELNDTWERLGSVANVHLDLNDKSDEARAAPAVGVLLRLSADIIRLVVPHRLKMVPIFNSVINTAKAVKQLRDRFYNHQNEFSTVREPQQPKRIPRLLLSSRVLLVELQDDTFEWKLGRIFRAGLAEQAQRLAREEAFYRKLQETRNFKQRDPEAGLRVNLADRRSTEEEVHQTRNRTTSSDMRCRGELDKQQRAASSPNASNVNFLSSEGKCSEETAWYRLQRRNAQLWKHKIDTGLALPWSDTDEFRKSISTADEPLDDIGDSETILPIPDRLGLMSMKIHGLRLVVDEPTFSLDRYPRFLHEIGKGMPMSMKYDLLIPMSIDLQMGEVKVSLRDYPLDFIHIPALCGDQADKAPSCSLQTNLVIAEEWRDNRSARQAQVELLPPRKLPNGKFSDPYTIHVWRSVSPIKSYSNPIFEIYTSLPTSISWGVSYQPVMQDIMGVLDGFSKPSIDPSDPIGFWDKVRLGFHSRIQVLWTKGGDVHLRLKGSRDPYALTGSGGGFVMCWRGNVKWEIHTNDNPMELMNVTSSEYILAIPDYSFEARKQRVPIPQVLDNSSTTLQHNAADFKKVIVKLAGDVKWTVGLVFERDLNNDMRTFHSSPHYNVVLHHPRFIGKDPKYDAYRGFRSDYIHLSLGIIAPQGRNWAPDNEQSSITYNAIHLTPLFFTHFYSWWALFSRVMSLPVRQGSLWPETAKSNKSSGGQLATIEYKLLLAPLSVAHIYKYMDSEDPAGNPVRATGLKVRLDSLVLDAHQRREKVRAQTDKESTPTTTTAMRFHEAEIDLQCADFRAISSHFQAATPEHADPKEQSFSSYGTPPKSVKPRRFMIHDRNLDWIDVDDFVEPDWILQLGTPHRTEILPLAYAPRIIYTRHTEHGNRKADETGYSTFGREPTHECAMSKITDPRCVQTEIVKKRLAVVESQIGTCNQHCSDPMINGTNQDKSRRGNVNDCGMEALMRRKRTLISTLHYLEGDRSDEETSCKPEGNGHRHTSQPSSREEPRLTPVPNNNTSNGDGNDGSDRDEFASDYDNRFMVHNPQLKWANRTRDVVYHYVHRVSQRRGFVYYMSQRALRFIDKMAEEQNQNVHSNQTASRTEASNGNEQSQEFPIDQSLSKATAPYVPPEDAPSSPSNNQDLPVSSNSRDDSPEFLSHHSYHLQFFRPQIQLLSKKNPKSTVLLAAQNMDLKVISVLDRAHGSDDVSGLVQRRFTLDMKGGQFFVATKKNLMTYLPLYSGSTYGNPSGSAWPPWLSLEANLDSDINSAIFSRVLERASAHLQYIKNSTYSLKDSGNAKTDQSEQSPKWADSQLDKITVYFPQFHATCDSTEYSTLYTVLVDLLLYSEPLSRAHDERLEKMMLAFDFSDLQSAADKLSRLQVRIRQLQEVKSSLQVQDLALGNRVREVCWKLECDLFRCHEELHFMMEAIHTAQKRKKSPMSNRSALLHWTLSAKEAVWHLIFNAQYSRTDYSDGSDENAIILDRVNGLNLLPDARYGQILAPYPEVTQSSDKPFLRVRWRELQPVAGIAVIEEFEVLPTGLKVQLERKLGQMIFKYIFPGSDSNPLGTGDISPSTTTELSLLDNPDGGGGDHEGLMARCLTSRRTATDVRKTTPSGLDSVQSRLSPTLSLPTKAKSAQELSNASPVTSLENDDQPLEVYDGSYEAKLILTHNSGNKQTPFGGPQLRPSAHTDKTDPKETASKEATGSTQCSNSQKDKVSGTGTHKDELSEMMFRASKYMALTHVKIHDVVICLSYKGKRKHNVEDLHDFIFRLPLLEYSNKLWSSEDLALRYKREVVKALFWRALPIVGKRLAHVSSVKWAQAKPHDVAIQRVLSGRK